MDPSKWHREDHKTPRQVSKYGVQRITSRASSQTPNQNPKPETNVQAFVNSIYTYHTKKLGSTAFTSTTQTHGLWVGLCGNGATPRVTERREHGGVFFCFLGEGKRNILHMWSGPLLQKRPGT